MHSASVDAKGHKRGYRQEAEDGRDKADKTELCLALFPDHREKIRERKVLCKINVSRASLTKRRCNKKG